MSGEYQEGISIIVPVYNVEKWLSKCFQSILAQTDDRYELIIVNDGSTDGSEDICMSWKSRFKNCTYIKQENSGLGAARNTGARAATREFITFVDSDDWIDESFVESMLSVEGKDIVYCDCRYVIDDDDIGVIADFRSCQQQIDADPYLRMAYGYPNMWGAVYRTSIWKDNGLSIPEGIYEDTAYYGVILEYFKSIGCISKPLYFYRTNRNGSLMQLGKKNPKLMEDALKRLIERAKERNIFDGKKSAYEAFCVRQLENEWEKVINGRADLDEKSAKALFEEFLDEHFDNWRSIYDRDLIAIGSYNVCAVFNRIVLFRQSQKNKYQFFSMNDLLEKQISSARYSFRNTKNKFRLGMVKKLLDNAILRDIDDESVVLIDLLNETNDLICIEDSFISKSEAIMESLDLYGEMVVIPWKDEKRFKLFIKACDSFKSMVKEKRLKVFILELYYTRAYKDGYQFVTFENTDDIDAKNLYLKKCYDHLKAVIPDAVFISLNSAFNYTAKNFPFGCEPCHLNEFAYFLLAQSVIKDLQNNE